ncbi:hypothetical protein CGZ80_13255 [Rhodopirellula sp. MGV]|nr:hypothetical protein CGZ80_13255 [Rhodopirellula sp. MGV]PNY38124.1 hypothetical protein C2E31_03690 [Rhodopirellula baltica]
MRLRFGEPSDIVAQLFELIALHTANSVSGNVETTGRRCSLMRFRFGEPSDNVAQLSELIALPGV